MLKQLASSILDDTAFHEIVSIVCLIVLQDLPNESYTMLETEIFLLFFCLTVNFSVFYAHIWKNK